MDVCRKNRAVKGLKKGTGKGKIAIKKKNIEEEKAVKKDTKNIEKRTKKKSQKGGEKKKIQKEVEEVEIPTLAC